MIVLGRFLSTVLLLLTVASNLSAKPRLFVATDLYEGKGDPDDGHTVPVFLAVRPGQRTVLSAPGTADPDGHAARLRGYAYPMPIKEGKEGLRPDPLGAALDPSDEIAYKWVVPTVSEPTTISLVLEVTDSGTPSQVARRRAIIRMIP